ncbi:MAG: triose-phosphate isomerase [Deltaproteobacteria bacterium]|nr:triose-phosphate isomerase [Deltaproteobacteria bacterium]MBW2359883.1 triose-phosphate isomerase [Deltaproteobacteria bacterium]
MRRPILAANWKMHKTAAEAAEFVEEFLPLVADAGSVDIVLAPTFTALDRVANGLRGSNVALAAQNVNPEEQGAFTGEIAPGMLAELGCRYGIVGHSERRAIYSESDDFIASKAAALFAHGICPIVCVGETLEEREANRTLDVVGRQLVASLAGVPEARAAEVVVAYEPVWAIGTGKTATPELAQEVHAAIRSQLGECFGAAGDAIRIQYGGSVKPENVDTLMAQPDIDGALVGGASLAPETFARIVRFERLGGAS